jgi:hypothetical protein
MVVAIDGDAVTYVPRLHQTQRQSVSLSEFSAEAEELERLHSGGQS